MQIQPIGLFKCKHSWPFEAASQATLSHSSSPGIIELFEKQNFEQALEDLKDLSHIWVLFWFHHNSHWKPKTSVPRGANKKISVFATRSPYRPNPIGLSLLEISAIHGRQIFVRNHDLLDETPILDIKPYHPQADAPQSTVRLGWMETLSQAPYKVFASELFETQNQFLIQHGIENLKAFCIQQLQHSPLDQQKKRVTQLTDTQAILAYRTWRVLFSINDHEIQLQKIFSGYSSDDLALEEDRWADKHIHRMFNMGAC